MIELSSLSISLDTLLDLCVAHVVIFNSYLVSVYCRGLYLEKTLTNNFIISDKSKYESSSGASVPKVEINTFLCQQFSMCSTLSHSSLLKDKDPVNIHYSGQSVGYSDGGSALLSCLQGFLDNLFTFCV